MKAKLPYLLYAIIILSFSITFTMCKKKEQYLNKLETNSELTQRDQKILNLVKNFTSSLNERFKDDKTMAVDSVIWYLESTLNVYYCRIDTFKMSCIDSTFITIPLSSKNLVQYADVDTAYLNLVDSLRSHYFKTSFNNKKVL